MTDDPWNIRKIEEWKERIEEEHNTFQEYWTKMADRVDEIGDLIF